MDVEQNEEELGKLSEEGKWMEWQSQEPKIWGAHFFSHIGGGTSAEVHIGTHTSSDVTITDETAK